MNIFPPQRKYLIALLAVLQLTATHAFADERELLPLNQEQQQWVKETMRRMLETLGAIQGDLAQENTQAIASRIQQMNQYQNDTKPQRIGRSFPQGFRAMANGMHQQWDALAESASVSEALKNSQQLMNYCNACHRSYRLPSDE